MNYVLYQETSRASTTNANYCMVVATGATYAALVLGLGSVTPYCRVTHGSSGISGFAPTTAWADTSWTSYSSAAPNYMDEGLSLVTQFPTLDPGASITFTWTYALATTEYDKALGAIAAVTIVEPTDIASGTAASFAAIIGGSVSQVLFYVCTGTVNSTVGSLTTPTSTLGDGSGLYSIALDTTAFTAAGILQGCLVSALPPLWQALLFARGWGAS